MRDMEQTDVDGVCEAIYLAILERRLEPNTRLVETKLAAALGASRATVRQALLLLAQRRLVTLHPNKGAEVAEPTREQALEVFQARRCIESEVVTLACRQIKPRDLARLRAHLAREQKARHDQDRHALIRATGEFHLILADIAGNQPFLEFLRQLTALSSLILDKFQPEQAASCDGDHHRQLVEMMAAGQEAQAQQLMRAHLDEIEASLVFERRVRTTDLQAVFQAVRKPLQ